MTAVPIFEAKNKLPFFIHLAEEGETIQLTRHGKPVARIIAEEECAQKTEGEIFMAKVMEWRKKHPYAFFNEEDEKAMYDYRHRIEPGIRHPEDFD